MNAGSDDPIARGTRAFLERAATDPAFRIEVLEAGAELVRGLTVRATARQVSFAYDEPPNVGGDDTGPGPAESLLAALGASLIQFAVMHGRLRRIPIAAMRVEARGELDLHGVLGLDPAAPAGYTRIEYTAEVSSPAPASEVAALLEFVERTNPVLATFRHGTQVAGRLTIVRQ